MDEIMAIITGSGEEEVEEHITDDSFMKKIAERVTELDSLLVDIHAVAAIEERGLSSLLRHLVPTCYFLGFLLSELSSENLLFFLEVDHFKKKIITLPDQSIWRKYAQQMYETYVKPNSVLEINIISPVRDAVKQGLSQEAMDSGEETLAGIFDACQKACFVLMLDTWKRYLASENYSTMMIKLKISNLNDIDVKKEAIRSVLSHFRGDAAEIDESDFDFLGAAAGKDSKAMIKEKTIDFLKRSNTYNNPDLDPVQILENWDKVSFPAIAILDHSPKSPEGLTFKKGTHILVDDASGELWKGRINGKGNPGLFPPTTVEQIMPQNVKENEESLMMKSFMPMLLGSIVQASCQIIHCVQPPVASWVLDGLMGTLLSVCQVVNASDSVAHRIYIQKDVRLLQHCSVEVLRHLKTLNETIFKAYVTNDTRLRSSNPNYLGPGSVEKTLSVITDLIRATKELSYVASPIINSYCSNPNIGNIGLLMKVLSERSTIVDIRRSLEQSHTFLQKSIAHTEKALEVDDLGYLFRCSIMTLTAGLQMIESVSNMNQLDQKVSKTTTDLITAIYKNVNDIYESIMKIVSDPLRTSIREQYNRIGRFILQLEKNSKTLVDDISQTQNVSEASVPESGAEHSDTQPVDELTKNLVGSISEFLKAMNENRKTELLWLADNIGEEASKLGNKIGFELKNLGISGIKKFEEFNSDGSEFVAAKKSFSGLSVVEGKRDDLEASMKSNVKDLARGVMGLLPSGDLETEISKRKTSMDLVVSSVKQILSISRRTEDLCGQAETKQQIKKWDQLLSSCFQRLEYALRDVAGLIPSKDAIQELKTTCTDLLSATKQLSLFVYEAVAQPDFGDQLDDEEQLDSLEELSFEPKQKVVSPFDPVGSRRAPLSPFDSSGSGGRAPMSPFAQSRRNPPKPDVSRRASLLPTPQIDSGSQIKNDLNAQLQIISEGISKLKTDATLAAGVWPPPHVFDDIRKSCQNIAKSIKVLLSCYTTIATGERDRKEKELANEIGLWKTYRLHIHSHLIKLTHEIVVMIEHKQSVDIEERRQYLIKKQEKHQTPSKVWIEKASNTDYEKWYKGVCTEEILMDKDVDDIELEQGSDFNDPRPNNVKGGTLSGLVRMLTYYKYPDPEYTHAMLMTYRSFTTSEELLSLIIERYNVSPEEMSHPKQIEYYYAKKIVPIRMRVSNIIRSWLEDHFEDFQENNWALLNQLNEFVNNQMTVTDENLAQLLKKVISKKLEGKEQVVVKVQLNPPEVILPKNWFGDQTKIVDISPLEIARQLCLIDQKIFSSIQAKEFLNQAWSKEALKARSPNLRAMIKRSNDLTYFTATEILQTEDLEERQAVFLHFVQIAEKCFELNNFNCVLAIYSGLTSSPIHRLKKTWAILELKENQAIQTAWKKLEEFTDSSNNHSKYRNTLHSINPPCVPFLGQYLTDLVFIDDGNPDTLQIGDKAIINFQKRLMTCSVIREVHQFQQTPYNFKDWNQLLKYLLRNSHLLDDSSLYKQSLKVEPRTKA